MPDVTQQFVMQYERRMRAITVNEYARRLSKLWWNRVMRMLPIEGKTERLTWFLETMSIEPLGPSGTGKMTFESMVTQTAEYPTFKHGKGLVVQRDQFEDLDGTGLNQVAVWSKAIGNEIAYFPQRIAAQLLLNGAATDGTANAYDGVPFFTPPSAPHYNNPYDKGASASGTNSYANLLTSTAAPSGFPAYPGALPIHGSGSGAVTTDAALENMGRAIAYIASLKMPNNKDPRFLAPRFIGCAPALAPRLRQLTDAKQIAQAAATGGGGADVIALIKGWELGEPVVMPELAASTSYAYQQPFVTASTGNVTWKDVSASGSDTDWYIFCEEMQTSEIGGLLYVSRKPFKVQYYTGDNGANADLDRKDEFEYHAKGRVSGQYGHPYTIFKIKAS